MREDNASSGSNVAISRRSSGGRVIMLAVHRDDERRVGGDGGKVG